MTLQKARRTQSYAKLTDICLIANEKQSQILQNIQNTNLTHVII